MAAACIKAQRILHDLGSWQSSWLMARVPYGIWKRVRATFVSQHHCVCVIMPQSCIVTPGTGVFFCQILMPPATPGRVNEKSTGCIQGHDAKIPQFHRFFTPPTFNATLFLATPHLVTFSPVGVNVEIQNAPCRNIKCILMTPKNKSATAKIRMR